MRASTWLILGGVGVLGYWWWKKSRPQAPTGSIVTAGAAADALTTGLEAGIAAGTYDAAALRNAVYDTSVISAPIPTVTAPPPLKLYPT